MPSNNVFQYSKIRTRKRSAKKSIKTGKKMESSSFWNPESTVLESGIQYPESGIHSMESRIQDCLGFPYMGRQNCSRRNWRKKVDFASYRRNTENAGKCHIASVKIIFLNNDKLPALASRPLDSNTSTDDDDEFEIFSVLSRARA